MSHRSFFSITRLGRLPMFVAMVLASRLPAQQAGGDRAPASTALAALEAALARGDRAAADEITDRLAREGSPLVEEADLPGHSLVSFVYQGGPDVRSVRLDSNLGALLIRGLTMDFASVGMMRRIPGSDLWSLTFRLRHDIRTPYRYEVTARDTTFRTLDPRNPVVWEPDQSGLAASILELEGAPPQPWRNFSESDVGDWDEWQFDDGPDAGRTVYVYKPRGWDPERASPYPVLVGLGAFGHGIGMRVDRLVDHLIETGRIPPVVVALADLESGSDADAYGGTTDFLADRFLPWLRQRYHVASDPEHVAVSGTSRRGMVAALVAFRRPDAVRNVISLSGSYYWKPAEEIEYEWVPRLYATHPRRAVKLYVTAGELETVVTPGNAGHYMVGTNRHFRDVLRAAGYALVYREFNGVHSELSWQDGLADGLVHFFGGRP